MQRYSNEYFWARTMYQAGLLDQQLKQVGREIQSIFTKVVEGFRAVEGEIQSIFTKVDESFHGAVKGLAARPEAEKAIAFSLGGWTAQKPLLSEKSLTWVMQKDGKHEGREGPQLHPS